MTLKTTIDSKQLAILYLRAHETNRIFRQAWYRNDSNHDQSEIFKWMMAQWQDLENQENVVRNAWDYIEILVESGDEDGFVRWNKENAHPPDYGTNPAVEASVREQFRKLQLALGKR